MLDTASSLHLRRAGFTTPARFGRSPLIAATLIATLAGCTPESSENSIAEMNISGVNPTHLNISSVNEAGGLGAHTDSKLQVSPSNQLGGDLLFLTSAGTGQAIETPTRTLASTNSANANVVAGSHPTTVSSQAYEGALSSESAAKSLVLGIDKAAFSADKASAREEAAAELSGTLSGTVYHWSKQALISGVTVADTSALTTTTDAQGAYSLANMSAGTYSLSASKTPDANDLNRTVTSADALAALKIAVGLNPNGDPDGAGPLSPMPVSSYQLISADMNGDGRVTSGDALAILKVAVGLSDAAEPSWAFVADHVPVWSTHKDRNAVYSSPIAVDVTYPNQTEVHFAAILMGDVNASWQAPEGSAQLTTEAVVARAELTGAPTSLWGLRDPRDTNAPVITLLGEVNVTHEAGTTYTDAGATAEDAVDGAVNVSVSGSVGSATGVYTITYQAADSAGNIGSATRTVTVQDTQPPVVTLSGASTVEITLGTTFTDPGATAQDAADGELQVSVSGTMSNAPGVYTLTYTATDAAGNSASASRTITVVDAPVGAILAVLDNGVAVADWGAGIKAFDGALDYADCTMSGATVCQSMAWQVVQDNERGAVLEVAHNAGAQLAGLFIQASTPLDLRDYANGALEFDIKVVSGDSRITMKLDCVYPCTSGDKPLGALDSGQWLTIRIALADLKATGLDLSKVNTGIVIWATGHDGTVFLLDNIRFTETLLGEPFDFGGGSGGGPVGVDYTIIPYGAGSVSDTINPASYRCVYDYGNWIYSAGIVRPGIAGCETATQTPIGEPSPLSPNLVEPASLSPTPTHKWWGSIPFLGEMIIGDPNSAAYITPDPLTVRITNGGFRAMGIPNGLRVVNPNEFAYPIPDPFGEVMDGIAIGHSSGTNLQGYLKDHSDGSVTVQWQNAGVAVLEATFVHGSPYVYLEVLSGDLVIKTLRANGGEKGIFYQQASSLGVWTSVAGNHNNYLITGEGATTFSGVESDRINASNSSGKYTLTYLPQTSGEPNSAMIQTFLSKALNRVAKVDITYSVDRSTNAVAITHTYRDDAGQPIDTMAGMLPLHWKNAQNVVSNYSVRSARGVTKFVEQSAFTYTIPYGGALPALPTLPGTVDQTVLAAKVQSFLDQGESSWNTYNDAYWSGKNYSKVAELIAITRSVGMTTEADRLTVWLKSQLEDWFNAERDGQLDTQYYFMYDDEWNTLLAMEESFASHQNLNDHHFHYGYLVRAAVEVCRNEPAWCGDDQYGPMIELLIRDYAAGRDDPMFPYLRHFDPANGFSWASGNVNFARGNNNESTSEAANAYGAMVLFGLIKGDDAMVERGMYLHASTAAAYWEYWNNIDGYRGETGERDNFPPGYDKISTSIIWGDGAVFSTWFSGAYAHILGIQGLPSNPLILHVGLYSDYMQDYVALGLSESSNGKPSGLPDDQWRDLWWNLWALANPSAALADYNTMSSYLPEQGESLAHTYHWLHTFAELGQLQTGTGALTADYPAAMVFDNAGVKTYVMYNYGSDARQVRFSDGVVVNAAAGQFTVYQQ